MPKKSGNRISRNKKKYWRKEADVSEVSEFLKSQRVDEHCQLERRKLIEKGCFDIDKVPGSTRKFAVENVESRPYEQTRSTTSYTSRMMSKIVKSTLRSGKRIDLKKKEKRVYQPPVFYDLWDQNATDVKLTTDLPDDDLKDYYLRGTKKITPNIPKTMKVPFSTRDHVDLPDPGLSYNPVRAEHQKLVNRVEDAKLAKINKEERVRRSLEIPAHETPATEESARQELLQGLFEEAEEDSEQEDLEATTNLTAGKRNPERKTKAQRRREARAKQLHLAAIERKKRRIADNEIFRLKSIKRELRNQEESIRLKQLRNKERNEQKLNDALRLGPHKFVNNEEQIVSLEKLPRSMRLLKNHGSLVLDRYKSFERRNVIEPRYRVQKKKAKRRTTEKECAKIVDENYIPDNPFGL